MLVTIYSPPYREGLGEGLPPLGEVGGGSLLFHNPMYGLFE